MSWQLRGFRAITDTMLFLAQYKRSAVSEVCVCVCVLQVNVNWTGHTRTLGGRASGGWARRRRRPRAGPRRQRRASARREPCVGDTTSCAGGPRARDTARFMVTFTLRLRPIPPLCNGGVDLLFFSIYVFFLFDFHVFNFVSRRFRKNLKVGRYEMFRI